MIIVDINSIYWQCFFPEWQQWETNKPSALDIQQASGKESLLQTKTLSWDLNQQSIKASNSAPGTPQSLGRQTANCLGRQLACVSQRLHTRVENLRLWHVWSCYPTYLEGTFFSERRSWKNHSLRWNDDVHHACRNLPRTASEACELVSIYTFSRAPKKNNWYSITKCNHTTPSVTLGTNWLSVISGPFAPSTTTKALDSSISISPSLTGQWLLATAVGFLRFHLLHEQLEGPPWGGCCESHGGTGGQWLPWFFLSFRGSHWDYQLRLKESTKHRPSSAWRTEL